MAKIIWQGVIKSEEEFPASEIPKHAVKLEMEEDMKKMQMKAMPFMIPSVLICIVCMLVKTVMAEERVIHFGFLFVGVLAGILLLIVHELLHAVAFPKDATVYIGIMPKSMAAVALSPSPVKRNRFLFISMLPVILGVIPLVLFCINGSSLQELNGLLFGMAVMGMVSVYPDLYNAIHILKAVPSNAMIQNDKNITYYFKEVEDGKNNNSKGNR